jgi:hypothetical protein
MSNHVLHRTTVAIAAATAALALSACGRQDPQPAPQPTTTAAADLPASDGTDFPAPHGEHATPAGPKLTVARTDLSDPRIKLAADYAVTAATWTPRTWIDRLVRLKDLATGTALEDLETPGSPSDAAQALAADDAASTATLLSGQLAGKPEARDAATVIVVLKVTATSAGQPRAPEYDVAEVTVMRLDDGWRVSDYVLQP